MHRSDSINIAKLAQTGRSSTIATPFTTKPDRESSTKRSHLSLHGHKHHHHSRRSSKYGGDDKEIKSAVLPTSRAQFPEINIMKATSGSGNGSNASGGSGSANDLISPSVVAEYDHSVRRVPSRIVKPEDVARERARQKQREDQLHNALRMLDKQSMATTRRLDDTYYSILEKVAGLHGAIDGLQELSTLTRRLRAEFATDADELADEVDGSLDGIGDFAAQARLLDEFEARIVAGKDKAAHLNQRLDAARRRCDERERLEEEWRASVNRRLRIFWSVLGALAALFLVVYIVYGIRTQRADGAVPRSNKTTTAAKPTFSVDLEHVAVPPPVQEILESVHSSSPTGAATTATPLRSSSTASDDERLHVFDEL